ncbi:MAG: PH domain-containing protein [Actinomycetota bacterium]|nr:PH domain-containing protein [Actinomycetota bacterium]
MPAVSEPALPHTWRPLGVRVAGTVAGVMLLALCVAAWIALGAEIRNRFTPWQRVTLMGLGLLGAAVWFALLRSRLRAADDGVTVVNGFKRRNLEWAQIVALRLRRGAPWAEMDLSDGTTIPVMAIQGSDGDRARSAVREFRTVLADLTSTERDD